MGFNQNNIAKKYKQIKRRLIIIGIILFSIGIVLFIIIIMAIFAVLLGGGNQSDQQGCTTNTSSDVGNIATSKDKTKNAQSLFNGFIKMGATKESAAAWLGVLDFESDFNPTTVNSSGYTGMAQWGGDRLSALKSYASSKGGSNTLQGQLAFLQHELNTDYKGVSSVLKSKNIDEAVETITKDYEGLRNYPDQWHFHTTNGGHIGRIDSAKQWYAKFAGNSGGIANQGQASDNQDNDTGGDIASDCGSDNTISSGDFVFPFANKIFPATGQNFGMRNLYGQEQWHDGWDIGLTGEKIHAVHNGKVIFAGDPMKRGIDDSFPNGLGKQVIVTKASDGIEIVYQEYDNSSSNTMVKTGQVVKAGQVIGTLKSDHLHIGFTKKDWVKAQADAFTRNSPTWLDPTKFIGGKNVKTPKE